MTTPEITPDDPYVISQEFFGLDVKTIFAQKIPQVRQGLNKLFRNLTKNISTQTPQLTTHFKPNQTDFGQLADLLVPIPYGMTVKYSEHLSELTDRFGPLETFIDDILPQAFKYFGGFLSNPKGLNQALFDDHFAKMLRDFTTTYPRKQVHQFNANDRQGEAPLSKVFDNTNDIKTVDQDIDNATKRFKHILKPTKVKQQVEKLAKLADAVLVQGEKKGMSDQAKATLSDVLNELAQWVEWYSLTVIQFNALVNSYQTTLRVINANK